MTARNPRRLISPLAPTEWPPIVRSSDMYISPWLWFSNTLALSCKIRAWIAQATVRALWSLGAATLATARPSTAQISPVCRTRTAGVGLSRTETNVQDFYSVRRCGHGQLLHWLASIRLWASPLAAFPNVILLALSCSRYLARVILLDCSTQGTGRPAGARPSTRSSPAEFLSVDSQPTSSLLLSSENVRISAQGKCPPILS